MNRMVAVFIAALVAALAPIFADEAAPETTETYDQWLDRMGVNQRAKYPLGVPEHGNVYLGNFPGETSVSRWNASALEGTWYPRRYIVKTRFGNRSVFYELWGFKVGGFAAVSTVDGRTDEGYSFEEQKPRLGIVLDYYGASRLGDRQLTIRPTIGFWNAEGKNSRSRYRNEEDETELGLRVEHNVFDRDTDRLVGVFDVNVWLEWQYELNHDKKSWLGSTPIQSANDPADDRSGLELGLAVDVVQHQWCDQRSRLALAPVIAHATGREESDLFGSRLRYTHRMNNGRQVNVDAIWFQKDVDKQENGRGFAFGLSFPF